MFEKSFSLEKLSEFVGRKSILENVSDWLQDDDFHVIFFSGDYGIGKTRLLQHILNLARKELKYDGTPTRLIDLYHFRHHSPEGLAREIVSCFENTDNEGFFEFYYRAHAKLERARAAGNGREIRQQLGNLLDSCVSGLKKMSKERGLLLLFDTVEQFVYPSKKGERFAPGWAWLQSWIIDLPRGVVLFAGRPEAKPLFQQSTFPKVSQVPLDFFTLDESKAYLLAIAKRWSLEKEMEFGFADEDVHRLHSLSRGRPILLAIFIELRMQNPQAFKDLSMLHPETFEQKIIDYLLSQPELGETLKAAGRTPKGINAELLAHICGIPERAASQALELLENMSFAKTFPDIDRVFLHDEMYALLDKYIYSDIADVAEGQEATQAIYYYYKQAMKHKDDEIQRIFTRLAWDTSSEQPAILGDDLITKIRSLEAARQELKTEFLFYRLRHPVEKEGERKAHEDDPILAGLKNYYRFGHEAATSHDDSILIPLQIELINFWLRLKDENLWKPFIEGLLLVHDVWLREATGQPYLDAISEHEKNLDSIPNLSSTQKTVLQALLKTWFSMELVFTPEPDYDRAENIYTNIIVSLNKLPFEKELDWFKNVAMSLAHRQRAYAFRVRGMFQDAIEDFQEALLYSRAIDFFHEEATLRNDLGFAQMLEGLFQSAFENMWDGLQLRYRVAIGARIALSHSSLAQHFIATGAYEEARKHARYAIRVAESVGYRRGLGFANLAYAEATRRFAFSLQGPSNQAEYLQQAQDAIDIASHLLQGERARIIDSNLEEACLYRDRVRVEVEFSRKQAWFEKSDKQLREVEKEAEAAGIDYRLVDAVSNRVWLGYYAKNIEYAEQALREFETLDVLKPYWLTNGKYSDETRAEKNPILWSHIGKFCVGRGIILLSQWKNDKKGETLHDAARFIMLGMTYSTRFGPDHRGLREGRRTIYQELADLNPNELKEFCRYVADAEENEKIPHKPSALQALLKDHALWFST